MSLSTQATRDLANAGLTNRHVTAAAEELKTTLTGRIPTWVPRDQLWLPASMSSWDALARVLEYNSPIWNQLIAASTKTILDVMTLLRSFIRASSAKITDEFVDLDTWARLKYRVACHQQLLEIVRSRISSEEEQATLNDAMFKDDIFAVYVPICTTVHKYMAKYFSSGVPAPVAEDFFSKSSESESESESESKSSEQVRIDGWTKISRSDGSNSSAGSSATQRVTWKKQSARKEESGDSAFYTETS